MSGVCIALSGGVDSAAAAALLAAPDSIGAMLRLLPGQDTADAAAVCAALNIPFTALEAREAFAASVIAPFIHSYQAGETPNPCVRCNCTIKFGWLLDWALAQGCEAIATGHYAILERSGSRWALRAGTDPDRDQTYFLYGLTQHQLAHSRFPVGTLTKPEVRQLAASLHLPVAQKKDSQDICFVPDGDYVAELQRRGVPLTPGRILSQEGQELGRHGGAEGYTLGQRRGLGVSCGAPVYVLGKQGADLIVGPSSALYTREVTVGDCNWVTIPPPTAPLTAEVCLRYTRRRSRALVIPTDTGVTLQFDEPQRAVTPGQAAVFYDGPYVLGGGTIR